jgi:type IV pilus biogenesis protein CpaD/CtpE
MRKMLFLAAAAALSAACHSRSEDEVGAAPDQGDTTASLT